MWSVSFSLQPENGGEGAGEGGGGQRSEVSTGNGGVQKLDVRIMFPVRVAVNKI